MINLASLGTSYTLHHSVTQETSIVHIILYDDIKELIDMPSFVSLNQYQTIHQKYLSKSNALTRSYHEVSWYATTDDDFDLNAVVSTCHREQNDIIVVEIIRD